MLTTATPLPTLRTSAGPGVSMGPIERNARPPKSNHWRHRPVSNVPGGNNVGVNDSGSIGGKRAGHDHAPSGADALPRSARDRGARRRGVRRQQRRQQERRRRGRQQQRWPADEQPGHAAEGRHHHLRPGGQDHRVLPAAWPVGHLGDHGRERGLRHADPADRPAQRVRAVPGEVGHGQPRLQAVDDRAAQRHQVPRRRAAQRGRGQAEHRRLAQGHPARLRVQEHRLRHDARRRHGRGDHDRPLGRVPGVPVDAAAAPRSPRRPRSTTTPPATPT